MWHLQYRILTAAWLAGQGRNRRCITVDLKKPEGRAVVKALSAKADILVENFRPGVMEAWGLGPKVTPPCLNPC